MSQSTRNATVTLAATSSQIMQELFRPSRRTQFLITNTDASATIYIAKGWGAAVSGQGIVLPAGASYNESTDSGFQCWQGPVFAISSGATTISIVEVVDNGQ